MTEKKAAEKASPGDCSVTDKQLARLKYRHPNATVWSRNDHWGHVAITESGTVILMTGTPDACVTAHVVRDGEVEEIGQEAFNALMEYQS